MKLKNYQINAVQKLYTKSLGLLSKSGTRNAVFKAPTGSGKTIMMAEYLSQLAKAELPNKYVFLWISSNNLHNQSKEKLAGYLEDSRYAFSLLDEVTDTQFEENQVVFVNWESLTKQDKTTGDFINTLMQDTETDRSLPSLVTASKEAGLEIILIVDESHYHYWSKKSQELVQGIIGPKLIIEVSATPAIIPTPEELEAEDSAFISVKFEDVVNEGMIKTFPIINEAISKYSNFQNTADEVIIDASVLKRNGLVEAYNAEKTSVNPLLLIQLPSESQSTSALDKSKLEEVENLLKDKYNITVENGKLAVWLSERKDNVDGIEKIDSEVEILIFKQAIALGWDCPRAQILVMFRDIKVEQFEIQTIGRIMRMPEAKHYENDMLNQAYVYTNIDRVSVAQDGTSENYFKIHRAIRNDKYKNIDLPSVYLRRIDFGDLTLSFRKIFIEEANLYFGIKNSDSPKVAKNKADEKLELLPQELTKTIISDAIIENLDEQVKKEIFGLGKATFGVSPDEIKRSYEIFAKASSLPYAPVRSHTKIQQAIYDWFDKVLGYEKESRIEIQRIVVCSASNQKIFKQIIESSKNRFKEVDRKEKQGKQQRKETDWNVPEVDYFGENYETVTSPNSAMVYALEPAKTLLNKKRSTQEASFEKLLMGSKDVTWWYKNGEAKETYFAVSYTDPDTGYDRSFYPDYIVQFKNGDIGIYDTKSGITRTSKETGAKSDSLQKYISKNKRVVGGIVSESSAGWYVFSDSEYSNDLKEWKRFEI